MSTLPFAGLRQRQPPHGHEPLAPIVEIEIATLPEEPGWRLCIDLEGTPLKARTPLDVTIERAPEDWLHAWTQDREFHVDCGPGNLTEAVDAFTDWADGGARLAA